MSRESFFKCPDMDRECCANCGVKMRIRLATFRIVVAVGQLQTQKFKNCRLRLNLFLTPNVSGQASVVPEKSFLLKSL